MILRAADAADNSIKSINHDPKDSTLYSWSWRHYGLSSILRSQALITNQSIEQFIRKVPVENVVCDNGSEVTTTCTPDFENRTICIHDPRNRMCHNSERQNGLFSWSLGREHPVLTILMDRMACIYDHNAKLKFCARNAEQDNGICTHDPEWKNGLVNDKSTWNMKLLEGKGPGVGGSLQESSQLQHTGQGLQLHRPICCLWGWLR